MVIFNSINTINRGIKKFNINFDTLNNDTMQIKNIATKINGSLKNDLLFKLKQLHNNIYVDLTLIDNLDLKYRFSMIYILYHLKSDIKTIFQVALKHSFNTITYTTSNIYYGAGIAEREVYDIFGVFFKDHPDLRRVITDYGFRGNPLKKDFPLTGTTELFYSAIKKILVFKRIKLSQEMRIFEFDSPWANNEDFFTLPKTDKEEDLEMEILLS